MGEYKWEAMDMDYSLFDTPEPTPELISKTKAEFEEEGLLVY
jgi:hypothetical protein